MATASRLVRRVQDQDINPLRHAVGRLALHETGHYARPNRLGRPTGESIGRDQNRLGRGQVFGCSRDRPVSSGESVFPSERVRVVNEIQSAWASVKQIAKPMDVTIDEPTKAQAIDRLGENA